MDYEKGRVLILENDVAAAGRIRAIVEHLGPKAQCALQPEAFFEVVSKWRPSHIVVNLDIPEQDGISILQELGERECHARIAISCRLDNRILNAAIRTASEHGLCVTYFMQKPVRMRSMRNFLEAERCLLPPKTASILPDRIQAIADTTSKDILEAIEGNQIHLA